VKVFDLAGHAKCLECQTLQLTFDFKLDTIGTHFALLQLLNSFTMIVIATAANYMECDEGSRGLRVLHTMVTWILYSVQFNWCTCNGYNGG